MEKDMQDVERNLDKAQEKLNRVTQPALNKKQNEKPQRNWFQTPKEKKEEKKKLRLGEHTKLDGKRKVKIPSARATAEDRVEWELQKAAAYQVSYILNVYPVAYRALINIVKLIIADKSISNQAAHGIF